MGKERRLATCRHYAGSQSGDECQAGINLLQFNGGDRTGFVRKVPCFGPCGLFPGDNPTATCEKYSVYTKEEIAAQEAEFEIAVTNMLSARAAIVKEIETTGQESGTIKCLVCGNDLRYSRASVNGHIHAHCKTQGCVSWME